MSEDAEIMEDCNCEETPLVVYCKKCKRAYLCNKEGERIEISQMKALYDFFQKELGKEREEDE